jgi:hypothetical protein
MDIWKEANNITNKLYELEREFEEKLNARKPTEKVIEALNELNK